MFFQVNGCLLSEAVVDVVEEAFPHLSDVVLSQPRSQGLSSSRPFKREREDKRPYERGSYLVGIISLYVGFLEKLSLWSFSVTKACLVLSAMFRSVAICFASQSMQLRALVLTLR